MSSMAVMPSAQIGNLLDDPTVTPGIHSTERGVKAESADMRLVNHGLRPREPWKCVSLPVESVIDGQCPQGTNRGWRVADGINASWSPVARNAQHRRVGIDER